MIQVASLQDRFKKLRKQFNTAEGIGGYWLQTPVSFQDFVELPGHIGTTPLTKRQYKLVTSLVGDDPEKMFSDPELKQIGIAVWGKGSGKDYTTTLGLAYEPYVLLCNADPNAFLGQPRGESIDFINVAYSAAQAERVFFTKLKARIKTWRWLKRYFYIEESGKIISEPLRTPFIKNDEPVVRISKNEVLFPHGIRMISTHSENESWEGMNIFGFVLDELSAFRSKAGKRNARDIFETVHTSAMTRSMFWKGWVISFPRQEDDVTLQMAKDFEKDPKVYVDGPAPPWEVKPLDAFKPKLTGKMFVFNYENATYKVPVELKNELKRDPTGFACRVLCHPPKVESPYFDYPDAIKDCVNRDRLPICDAKDYHQTIIRPDGQKTIYVAKKLFNFRPVDSRVMKLSHVVHVDEGETGCNAALTLAHSEPYVYKAAEGSEIEGQDDEVILRKVVIDLILVWHPDKKKGIQVSTIDPSKKIQELAKLVRITDVTFDQWNSATSVEELSRLGIKCYRRNVTPGHYKTLKLLYYARGLDMPWYEDAILPDKSLSAPQDYTHTAYIEAVDELEHLVRKGETEDGVARDTGRFKDIADTIAGVVATLVDPEMVTYLENAIPQAISFGTLSAARQMVGPTDLTTAAMRTATPFSLPGAELESEVFSLGPNASASHRQIRDLIYARRISELAGMPMDQSAGGGRVGSFGRRSKGRLPLPARGYGGSNW